MSSRAQGFLHTRPGTEMIALPSGHLLTHDTRVDLTRHFCLSIDLSVNLDPRERGESETLTLGASASNSRSADRSIGPRRRVYCTRSADRLWVSRKGSGCTLAKGIKLNQTDPNSHSPRRPKSPLDLCWGLKEDRSSGRRVGSRRRRSKSEGSETYWYYALA